MSRFNEIISGSFFIIVLIAFGSCSNGFDPEITIDLNPNGISPLTALVSIDSKIPYQLEVEVKGDLPVKKKFSGMDGEQNFPVLGLYPNRSNEVVLTFTFEGGEKQETLSVETGPLPAGFPQIQINKLNRNKMEPGWHLCDFHMANGGKFRSVPMAFDDNGEVRWYLDLSFAEKMVAPIRRLKNGNFLACSRHNIYEFDLLGKYTKTTINDNYGIHHESLELPNGKLLLAVGKRDSRILIDNDEIWSDSDWFILYDRKKSQVVKEWDMAKHLDVSRSDLNFFGKGDWLHMNGFAYNHEDLSLILSHKNQGLAKLNLRDSLEWILSPKKNWGRAGRKGDGPDTNSYLLTAVNENGVPFDDEVQNGDKSAENFDFPWGNHTPSILPNGNILVFDNGARRNFLNIPSYSRVVEYKIDVREMTVQQVWQYGKERGSELFSSIVSDADYLPETGNILMTSGFLNPRVNASGKIVEVDYETKEEVFEATLFYKNLNGTGELAWGQTDILYRSERIEFF